jgi:hypothetical protein
VRAVPFFVEDGTGKVGVHPLDSEEWVVKAGAFRFGRHPGNLGTLVHFQDRFRVMSYGNEHEISYLRTVRFPKRSARLWRPGCAPPKPSYSAVARYS